MKPIDLKEAYGKTFRIEHDPAYFAEHGPNARVADPWLQIIPGAAGHIYPHSADRLGVATHSAGPVARKLAAMPDVRIEQEGSDGINASFPPSAFRAVTKLIRAKRRRTLTPEHKAKLIAAGAANRFPPGSNAAGSERNCVPSLTVD